MSFVTGIKNRRVLMRSTATDKVHNVSMRASEQNTTAALLHTPLRELRIICYVQTNEV